jgi:hypothetical protein
MNGNMEDAEVTFILRSCHNINTERQRKLKNQGHF